MIVVLSKKLAIFIFTSVLIVSFLSFFLLSRAVISAEKTDSTKDIVWKIKTDQKVIALTFDDGPDPKYTPEIIKILKQNGIKATFFVIGEQVEKYPQVAQSLVIEGNELANHTYTHPNLNRIGSSKIKAEIEKTHKIIAHITKVAPTLFRPPEGYYNNKIIDLAREEGYKTVMWSWTQDTRDWTNPGISYIINKVLKNANNGDIVIFHDCGGDRSQTVAALQPIIDGLKEQGFLMVTVSELLKYEQKNEEVTSFSGEYYYE